MKLGFISIRLLLGALLLWSGLIKARQPYEFLATVYSYQLVRAGAGVLIAAWLPWLEMFLGCCLIGGIFVEGALLITTLLTASFSLAIFSAWYRGLGINCGCFGTTSAAIDGQTVLRSVALLLLSSVGFLVALRLSHAPVMAGGKRRRPSGHFLIRRIFVPAKSARPSLQAVARLPGVFLVLSRIRSLSHRARLGR